MGFVKFFGPAFGIFGIFKYKAQIYLYKNVYMNRVFMSKYYTYSKESATVNKLYAK